MKALARWPEPAMDILDAVAAKKPLIKRSRPRVARAYRWYARHAPELGRAVSCGLTLAAGKAFLAAYKSAPQIHQLRAKVLQGAGFCPYCGINLPNTLDHYVPKSSFPEFALYPDNLVPCCGECNQRRGDRWLERGKRVHVNLYFDRIGAMPILRADILVQGGTVDVAYRVESAGGGKFAALYLRHVTSLRLLERFRQRAGKELEEWDINFKRNGYGARVGRGPLRNELRRDARTAVQVYGVNHWLTALRLAASESVDLVRYLCT